MLAAAATATMIAGSTHIRAMTTRGRALVTVSTATRTLTAAATPMIRQ
jgi:hypothetical protein